MKKFTRRVLALFTPEEYRLLSDSAGKKSLKVSCFVRTEILKICREIANE